MNLSLEDNTLEIVNNLERPLKRAPHVRSPAASKFSSRGICGSPDRDIFKSRHQEIRTDKKILLKFSRGELSPDGGRFQVQGRAAFP